MLLLLLLTHTLTARTQCFCLHHMAHECRWISTRGGIVLLVRFLACTKDFCSLCIGTALLDYHTTPV